MPERAYECLRVLKSSLRVSKGFCYRLTDRQTKEKYPWVPIKAPFWGLKSKLLRLIIVDTYLRVLLQ